MKETVLFGAGQVGRMTANLLGADYPIRCFADNSPKKQGSEVAGLPVVSLAEALSQPTDCCCICVTDQTRGSEMEKQLREAGFRGQVLRVWEWSCFDPRLAALRMLARELEERQVPGDVAELGVFQGKFAAQINLVFPDRTLRLFDTFAGFPEQDIRVEKAVGFSRAQVGDFSETSAEAVLARMPHPEQVRLYPGYFPETFDLCRERTFAFVSLDPDLYAPMATALPLFWDRLSLGGVLLIHDFNSSQFSGAGQALREFCRERGLFPLPLCDLHGSALLQKQG